MHVRGCVVVVVAVAGAVAVVQVCLRRGGGSLASLAKHHLADRLADRFAWACEYSAVLPLKLSCCYQNVIESAIGEESTGRAWREGRRRGWDACRRRVWGKGGGRGGEVHRAGQRVHGEPAHEARRMRRFAPQPSHFAAYSNRCSTTRWARLDMDGLEWLGERLATAATAGCHLGMSDFLAGE